MILSVTLNASIDKAYHKKEPIEGGTVMRVGKVVNSAGGKGLNSARAMNCLGADVMTTGFVGGHVGDYFLSLVEQSGLKHGFEHCAAETRSCINILEPRFHSTEFLEPGAPVTSEESRAFKCRFKELLDTCSLVTMSGSIPEGLPDNYYATLIKMSKQGGKRAFLDTSGSRLVEGIKAKPYFIKPNQDEISDLCGVKLKSLEETTKAAVQLQQECAEYVVVTLGADGCIMACPSGVYRGISAKVKAVNAVGSGDSFVGGFAVATEKGLSDEDCLRHGLAAGAANAASELTGNFPFEGFTKALRQCKIKKLANY